VPTDELITDDLASLVREARMLPAAILPRPRGPQPERHVVDLTALEIRIPDAALHAVDGFGD
jgi:hypothetical protein